MPPCESLSLHIDTITHLQWCKDSCILLQCRREVQAGNFTHPWYWSCTTCWETSKTVQGEWCVIVCVQFHWTIFSPQILTHHGKFCILSCVKSDLHNVYYKFCLWWDSTGYNYWAKLWQIFVQSMFLKKILLLATAGMIRVAALLENHLKKYTT